MNEALKELYHARMQRQQRTVQTISFRGATVRIQEVSALVHVSKLPDRPGKELTESLPTEARILPWKQHMGLFAEISQLHGVLLFHTFPARIQGH